MRPERLVMGAGGAFCLVVLGAALVPDSFWGSNSIDALLSSAQESASSSFAAVGNAGTAQGWGRKSALPGLVPFSQAKSERFRGSVVRLTSRGDNTGWSQIHIWVDNGSGTSKEVSVAPRWFLEYLGCPVQDNSRVRGVGFRFDRVRPNAELYAKNITVGKKSCRLRNDEGFALWSNQLR